VAGQGAFNSEAVVCWPMATTWYVAHGRLFEGEAIQSFSNEDDAQIGRVRLFALGEFLRELGSRATEKTFRKMDANEIKRFCATRR
jgi:hypothetical protein